MGRRLDTEAFTKDEQYEINHKEPIPKESTENSIGESEKLNFGLNKENIEPMDQSISNQDEDYTTEIVGDAAEEIIFEEHEDVKFVDTTESFSNVEHILLEDEGEREDKG